jgi:tripeptidyl-peptidase-2
LIVRLHGEDQFSEYLSLLSSLLNCWQLHH